MGFGGQLLLEFNWCEYFYFFCSWRLVSRKRQEDQATRNSDSPNCGSFHTRKIQGKVTDTSGALVKGVEVEVF